MGHRDPAVPGGEMIAFLAGMFIGGLLGAGIVCLCVIAKQSDDRAREMRK